jgi:predicted O-methyltransferase YrrM
MKPRTQAGLLEKARLKTSRGLSKNASSIRNLSQVWRSPQGLRLFRLVSSVLRTIDERGALRDTVLLRDCCDTTQKSSNWYRLRQDVPIDVDFRPKQIWIGPEHPFLERFCGELIRQTQAARVLEIGYQCGACTLPLVQLLAKCQENWKYVGIDLEQDLLGTLAYASDLLPPILNSLGVEHAGHLFFLCGDSDSLIGGHGLESIVDVDRQFDIVIIDHHKPLYPTTYQLLVGNGYIGPETIVIFHDVFTYAIEEWKQLRGSGTKGAFEINRPFNQDVGILYGI